jgi:DNA-binding CsgD family transcriptional regulator
VLAWALERGETETGLRLTEALYYSFYMLRGPLAEGRRWQERLLLAGADLPPLARANALRVAGYFAQAAGDPRAAARHLDEALSLARQVGDRRTIAGALFYLSYAAEDRGDDDRWVELTEEALAHFRGLGDAQCVAAALCSLGRAARRRTDYGRATALLEETLALYRDQGDAGGVALVLTALGEVAADEGDRGRTAAHFGESLRMHADQGNHLGIGFCLLGLGRLADAESRPEAAARLLAAAEALREARGASLPPADAIPHDRLVASVRTRLGEEAFAAAWTAGRAMPLETAIVEGLAVAALSEADQLVDPSDPIAVLGLTSREREVLFLLAAGRSNPEIAAALFISPRTVEWHVTNLFRKFGLQSRAAVAAAAGRRGLA